MHYTQAKTILSPRNSMNIYRGCTHGCVYCDSRSTCYNMQHDFEDVEVKINAPRLLEDALRRKRKKCMIGTGSMCDPYLPLERELKLTRQCFEIVKRYGFGLSVITKSDLILRDLDLLKQINEQSKCIVQMTLTTHDEALCKILEPNVCTTERRAEVLCILRDNGIPTVAWLSPILPFINDSEDNLEGLMRYCTQAEVRGIVCFGFGVTLRQGDREYFYSKLDQHFPGLKERYIKTYGNAYEVMSPKNNRLSRILQETCVNNGILYDNNLIFENLRKYENKAETEQICLFE